VNYYLSTIYTSRMGKYNKMNKKGKARKQNFRKKVMDILIDQKEMKVATFELLDGFVDSAINDVNDLRNLQPIIPQGTNSNNRIGDSIVLKKVVIRGYYKTSTPGFSTSASNARIQLRQFIMSQRGVSAQTLFDNPTAFEHNNFLENSQAYTGSTLDFITPVNKTAFSVKRERKYQVYQPVITAVPAAGQESTIGQDLNSSIKYFNHIWNCNQTLHYKTGGAGRSDDFKYFMANAVNMIDGVNDDAAIRLTYHVTFYYTDA